MSATSTHGPTEVHFSDDMRCWAVDDLGQRRVQNSRLFAIVLEIQGRANRDVQVSVQPENATNRWCQKCFGTCSVLQALRLNYIQRRWIDIWMTLNLSGVRCTVQKSPSCAHSCSATTTCVIGFLSDLHLDNHSKQSRSKPPPDMNTSVLST